MKTCPYCLIPLHPGINCDEANVIFWLKYADQVKVTDSKAEKKPVYSGRI